MFRSCVVLSFFSFIACDNSDYEKAVAENDSLRNELGRNSRVVTNLVSVTTLLDSIDATRHYMRVSNMEPRNQQDYASRMLELKDYIGKTEERILDLESAMVQTELNSESYQVIIGALKDELRIRNEELGLIEENSDLNDEVLMKTVQLEDVESRLEVKKAELKFFQLQIVELVRRMSMTEADGLYAQAGAMEEAAKRTFLAPHKKKETYRDALALYQESYAKGKKEAKAKVDELTAKVSPTEY